MYSTRPMPGYGGFVPRYPVCPENSYMHGGEQTGLSSMYSTTKSTYRLAYNNNSTKLAASLVTVAGLSHFITLLQGVPQRRIQGTYIWSQGVTVENGHPHLSIQSIQ